MEILLAKDMGFCWGVRRAIDIMEKAAGEHGEIISVGPIVHNPQVVEDLEDKGIRTGRRRPRTTALPVAITAHGVGPQVLDEVKATGAEIIDGTCPIVTRSQRWARKMAEAGLHRPRLRRPRPSRGEGRPRLGRRQGASPSSDGDPLPDGPALPRRRHLADDAEPGAVRRVRRPDHERSASPRSASCASSTRSATSRQASRPPPASWPAKST